MKKNLLLIKFQFHILYVFFIFTGLSVFSQCIESPPCFRPDEKITYEVAYNWGFVWVDAGEVYFRVDSTIFQNKKGLFLESYGSSYPFYDWMYKVRDRFQAVVDATTLEPMWFTRNTYEGGYEVNNRYNYLPETNQVISQTQNSDKPLAIDTLTIEPCTFDVLSAIYYARTINFSNYSPGDKIPIRFIIDGKIYELFIRYLGRENKKNRDSKTYDCIKFTAMLVEGTIFSEGEDLTVWVTADENKIPIMVEAKILIGSIKAYLTGYEGIITTLPVIESKKR